MKSQSILVTGGLGLIGHNVVQRLMSLGHNVVVTDIKTNYGIVPHAELGYLMAARTKKIPNAQVHGINIADQVGIEWLFDRYRPQTVVHLASFPRQKVVNANPALASRAMSEGLLNLLESAARTGTSRFVYISSSMVYGDFEDDVVEDSVCCPQGQYGIMKLAGEWLVKDYSRRGLLEHVIIRPSAVYGEYDVEDRVVSKFLLTAMRNGVIKVNGANETLDFTYVEDAADGIVAAALGNNTANKTYNITKSHSRTLFEAARMAVQIVGQGTIEVRDRDLDFPSRGALNIDAARKDFGFDPKVDVEEGFQRYYDWLIDHPVYGTRPAV
jgi:nucleoside-diphosphate-sugar epimerase